MRGKYSPTVNAAYMKDQEWWYKYSGSDQVTDTYVQYDPEGYDSYGYDKDDKDRAGNYEHEYYTDDEEGEWGGSNWAYDRALDVWGFDGVKPVERKK